MAIKEKLKDAPPYTNGKPTFKKRRQPGCYLIFKHGELRYVGYSGADLYKALYRHFQTWNDSTQVRVQYTNLAGITVRVIYTNTKQQASRLEKALIIKLKPTDNPQQYWLDFDTDNKEEEIYKEYTYAKWRKPKAKETAADEENYPF